MQASRAATPRLSFPRPASRMPLDPEAEARRTQKLRREAEEMEAQLRESITISGLGNVKRNPPAAPAARGAAPPAQRERRQHSGHTVPPVTAKMAPPQVPGRRPVPTGATGGSRVAAGVGAGAAHSGQPHPVSTPTRRDPSRPTSGRAVLNSLSPPPGARPLSGARSAAGYSSREAPNSVGVAAAPVSSPLSPLPKIPSPQPAPQGRRRIAPVERSAAAVQGPADSLYTGGRDIFEAAEEIEKFTPKHDETPPQPYARPAPHPRTLEAAAPVPAPSGVDLGVGVGTDPGPGSSMPLEGRESPQSVSAGVDAGIGGDEPPAAGAHSSSLRASLANAVSEANTTMEEFQSYFAQVQRHAVLESLIGEVRRAARPESADDRRKRLVAQLLREEGGAGSGANGRPPQAAGPEEDTDQAGEAREADAGDVEVTEADILRELELLKKERAAGQGAPV